MSRPIQSVTFKFIDPTDALVRLLLLSPLAANDENFSFYPKKGFYLADFHDGERMRRIHEELPKGAVALTSVLFFDEINLGQKGYRTGDGVVLMGGFFNKRQKKVCLQSTLLRQSLLLRLRVVMQKKLRTSGSHAKCAQNAMRQY